MNEIPLTLEQEAQNENTSPERLAELARMNNQLAYLVAQNINTPPETLSELAKSEHQEILKAENPNTPSFLLRTLVKNWDKWERREVARNPNTPVTILKILVKDSDSKVRQGVAENPNTPIIIFMFTSFKAIPSEFGEASTLLKICSIIFLSLPLTQ